MENPGLMPLGYCLRWRPSLMALNLMTDLGLMAVFLALFAGVILFTLKRRDIAASHKLRTAAVGLFFLACAWAWGMQAYVLWHPAYGWLTTSKVFAFLTGTAGLALLWRYLPRLVLLPTPMQLSDLQRKLRTALKQIYATEEELEDKVRQRTSQLEDLRTRFEGALRGAHVFVFTQDTHLRYTWLFSPDTARPAELIVGKTDFEVQPPASCGPIVALKQRALATGKQVEGEILHQMGNRPVWYRLYIDPIVEEDGRVSGLNGAAIDISEMKSLQQEQVRLAGELATNLQYYRLATETSKIVVFTQDKDLRYTSLSKDLFGRKPEFYLGKTDEEVLPPEMHAITAPLKKKVLETGETARPEISAKVDGETHWYELSIASLRDRTGEIMGLTCAAIDVSERKGWEQHLRLVMRELTHRSKNLLAVIQAMARQTARSTDTVEGFVERFGERLQALAGSHDLLVQESWHGASIEELIASQLGHYADVKGTRLLIKGPQVRLNPDAAQNLGMALHEMATNAAKYGALSTPDGTVSINWKWHETKTQPKVLRLNWRERGGPAVQAPTSRGFGSQVIERNLTRALGAKVDLRYEKTGFAADIDLPPQVMVD